MTREQILDASGYLELSEPALREYVARRLATVHRVREDTTAWLNRQAPVERDDLRPAISNLDRESRQARVDWRKTSGSTGTPFRLAKDMEMCSWMDATMWAVYAWHGLAPGAPYARFWGMPRSLFPRIKRTVSDVLTHRRRLDAFALSTHRATRYFRRLRRFRPEYAYGYPSLIRHFVEQCKEAGLDGADLGLRCVVTTGELLPAETRHVIADFFACPVVNEYGCTESGILGFECEAGTMHSIPIAAYPEIVGPNGESLDGGETGEVVVTDLYGEVVPLVRYKLHDRGSIRPSGCSCGRSLPELRVDSGRVDSFIQTPERGPVYDAILAYTVPRSVQRFRAFQRAIDRLEVDIVPGQGFDPHRTPLRCKEVWEGALGPGMTVEVHVREDIPHEDSGKLRYFVPMDSEE